MKKKKTESEFSQIIKAFVLGGDASDEVKERRLLICRTCPLNSTNAYDDLSPALKLKHRATAVGFCLSCGCPLAKRVSVKSATCGDLTDLKWDAED